jgi:HAD superfamily hydrolase (TIGR01549 family)
MPTIKAVLFDLDDTLWPVAPAIMRAEEQMFAWLGEHVPAVTQRFDIHALRARRMEMLNASEQYRFDMIGLRHAGLTEAFLHCGEDCDKVEGAMEVFNRLRNTVDFYEDVPAVLSRLSKNWILGSISNGPADLETIGLAPHFQVSVAAWRVGCGKPDPQIFRTACELLEVHPRHAVYVGDDPALDVEGAQKAGLTGIWLDREGRHAAGKLPPHIAPDAICTNLYEVEHWLRTASGMPAHSSIE